MEMPRASYDTWVRDTKALLYERGQLTVGVRNAYARDWLESRLQSTVSRLLIGIMNETVSVEFVVPQIEVPQESSEEESEPSNDHEIALAASTEYENEVKPHRVVVFPGYALRLLAQGDLNAKEMSLWIAFRQAAYFDWIKTKKKGATFTRNIPHQDVIRFANMSRTSFFREITDKDSLAAGMVLRVPEIAAQTYNNPYLDNANRWTVSMSPRLTRHDAAVIELILASDLALAEKEEKARIAAALQSLEELVERSPADYLDMSVKVSKNAPAGMMEVLRRTLGIEDDIPAALFSAAEALQNKIINAYGKVVVTHHFLTVIAPHFRLTQSQMWTAIVLRDRCFYDYETGIEHDFVMAPQGLESIAAWTGTSTKSLKRWMEQAEFRQLVQVAKVEIPENDRSEGAERLGQWLQKGGVVFSVRKEEPPLGYLPDEETDRLIPLWTKWDSALDKVVLGLGQSGTGSWTKWDSALDKVRLGFGQSGTPLNNLYKPLLNPNKPHKPHPTRSAAPSRNAAGGLGNAAYWDFDFLMRANAVNPGTVQNFRKRIKQGASIARLSELFVSWLLYAHSPVAGHVQNPVSIAIRRIQQNPHAGMPDFERLASLRPFELKAFFDADLAGEEPEEAGDPDADLYIALYEKHLSPLDADHKGQLYRRLFGG